MTVASLRRGMSQAEFVAWSVYYGRIAQRKQLQAAQRR